MLKLNRKQKEYLLDTMFSPGDIYKIFDSISRDWLLKQEFKLKEDGMGWYDVLVNGEKYTTVNFATYPEVLETLKTL